LQLIQQRKLLHIIANGEAEKPPATARSRFFTTRRIRSKHLKDVHATIGAGDRPLGASKRMARSSAIGLCDSFPTVDEGAIRMKAEILAGGLGTRISEDTVRELFSAYVGRYIRYVQ